MHRYWWQNAVVYQIYPRSFKDTNGDGIGDIPGITSKLDYIRDLGANVIWLCPVCCSPMADNGYDISDYDHIDPVFGTDEDFDELIREADRRGIRIVMDMVVNHCSSEHRWFQEALKDPEGKYGGYFHIRKGVPAQTASETAAPSADAAGEALSSETAARSSDAAAEALSSETAAPSSDAAAELLPPNNWRSIFGGSAWERIPGTDLFYLHIFAKEQPDLNWENAELREEIYAMINRWIKKGVAGFRMDAITYLKKEEGYPSYPADAEDGLVSVKYGALNKPGLVDILRELRDRTYGRELLTVGEAEGVGAADMDDFVGLENGVFSMIFDFSFCSLNLKAPNFFWYDHRQWSVEELKGAAYKTQASAESGWIGTCLECHDQPRSIDHYLPESGRNFYGASMLAAFNLFRRGTPYIYQGEEIGMRNIHLKTIGEYDDVSSKNQYARAVGAGFSEEEAMSFVHDMSRDNARTPFQWNSNENAGFTDPGSVPWLAVNPDYTEINAEAENENPASLLKWYRKLVRIRRESDVLSYGDFEPAYRDIPGLAAFRRVLDDKEIIVFCNWQDAEISVDLGDKALTPVEDNYGAAQINGGRLTLRPFEALIGSF